MFFKLQEDIIDTKTKVIWFPALLLYADEKSGDNNNYGENILSYPT